MRTHDGLTLAVECFGPRDAAVTVALAHCWTADRDDWRYQTHHLLGRYGDRIRLVTWDARGHGRSEPAPAHACTVADLGRDLGDLLDVEATSGRLVLAGHSIGGMTMMALAEQRPDLVARTAGALFVSTACGGLDRVTLGLPELPPRAKDRLPHLLEHRARRLSRRRRRRQPRIEEYVARRFLFGPDPRTRDVGQVVDQIISCPPQTMGAFYRDLLTHDRAAALTAYDGVPTRVLVGDRDLLTPVSFARALAGSIRGARLQIAPGAGHMLPLERPDLVSAHLDDLVDAALAEGDAP